jgi:hypothetical protein
MISLQRKRIGIVLGTQELNSKERTILLGNMRESLLLGFPFKIENTRPNEGYLLF